VSVATPVQAYVASAEAGRALPQTGTLTFQVNCPTEWQRVVPILTRAPNTANNSAGPLIYVFRSADGGTTYDNIPLQSLGFARPTAAQQQSITLKLEAGNYLVCVVMGGGVASTWTVQSLTQQSLTAILNQ
jgi:hypothetical protein